ncbi:ABC transporter ATP-binding protein [Lederbergia wuyishanensis]|uniref:ABC transport system ATP-binding protein n=1 Tax=Lederbergia wuyishanensis TaxID=1347903 RepID=A0ABU0D948_9BACI|nr:ABC transporter ATP-binding protein [Lederbergia wuyishanensis]MCJ8007545.1 ABC transporter ATP-binding protein [Lederbergia wuyishanensis]MDQ0344875.1 putative ABC transport system ATP-binding protein [Lederbergia wuyishanensis]
MEPVVKVENISKSFGSGNKKVDILDQINLTIEPYQLVALRGRSGSGKTTLLNLIGALDKPTDGEIYIEGNPISKYNEKQRSELRRKKMGFVFQSYGLVPLMTVEENIEFGLRIAGVPRGEWAEKINESLELVGLSKRAKHRPYEISGGEQQRVAIARAIATKPALLLADEPTAELDTKMAFHIISAFQELVKSKTTTIVMTTHDPGILEIIEHVYTLEDRKIAKDKQEIII